MKNTSRARRPIEPSSSPKHVHDETVTTRTSANGGTCDQPRWKSSSSSPTPKPNAETSSPLAIWGSARPRKSASRFAGVASSGESVWKFRSFAIPIVIP
ncbi:MAG: hypothetical protein QOG29_1793 [Gaiellaceae bacterium]|nr:hypothetical protein [Gaiellaceae bacterium]